MRWVVLLAASSLASGAFGQAMHKCVDARGVTHYTDRPMPGCKGGEVRIQGQPPISGTLSQPQEDLRRNETEFQRRRIAEERGREDQANALEQQRQRCAALHADLRGMESGVRLARPDGKGGYEFMEDDERNQRAAKLRDEIAQKCR